MRTLPLVATFQKDACCGIRHRMQYAVVIGVWGAI